MIKTIALVAAGTGVCIGAAWAIGRAWPALGVYNALSAMLVSAIVVTGAHIDGPSAEPVGDASKAQDGAHHG